MTDADSRTKFSRARSLLRTVVGVAFLSVALASCAPRAETGFLVPMATAETVGKTQTILVATTRQRDARPGTFFNGERAAPLDFAKIDVSVPPNHASGNIEWPLTPPGNPATDFVVRQAGYLDGDKAFVDDLNARLAMRPQGHRRIMLFVHGYNTSFAEALYRFAQLNHDADGPDLPVLFTWASRGVTTQYVYDTNSATAARDDLERTIRLLFASNADRVDILAHSMGNWITLEAMRQIKISGKLPPFGKLGSVVLAAPDIDIDVFKSQMRRFGKPPKPFFIVLSKDDQALHLSSLLAGGETRLGDDDNIAELTALGTVVIDLTRVDANDPNNHDKFAQLADIAPQLQDVLEKGIAKSDRSASPDRQIQGASLDTIIKLPTSLTGGRIRIFTGG